MRNEVLEVDRGQVIEGISKLAMPQPKQLPGESSDVVKNMDNYMSDLDSRKQRLSR
jgi:hypothetical protein